MTDWMLCKEKRNIDMDKPRPKVNLKPIHSSKCDYWWKILFKDVNSWWKTIPRHLFMVSPICKTSIQSAWYAAIDHLIYGLSVDEFWKVKKNWPSLYVFQPAQCQRPHNLQMFLKSCWKADKKFAFNRCLVPGLDDLLAKNDETVFQCLAARLAFIIMQAAVNLGDITSADGCENKTATELFTFLRLCKSHGFIMNKSLLTKVWCKIKGMWSWNSREVVSQLLLSQ